MANEIKFTYLGSVTSPVIVGIVQNDAGNWFNKATTAFEAYNAANVANYAAVTMVPVGSTTEYMGSFPATGVPLGHYRIPLYQQAGSALAVSDLVPASVQGQVPDFIWSGTLELNAAKSEATVLNDYTYNVATNTLTLMSDDGATVIGTGPLTVVNNQITARTVR